jgi:uncharacterized protein (DUF2141 family)
MKRIPFNAILVIAMLSMNSAASYAQNIMITITGIKSNKGKVIVSVFKDNESFKNEKPAAIFPFSKSALSDGTLKVNLTLEPGIYGLAMFDDQNSNGRMEKNFLHIPKEGFGFSNFYLSGMRRPVFDDFKFEVKNALVIIQSKLRYL